MSNNNPNSSAHLPTTYCARRFPYMISFQRHDKPRMQRNYALHFTEDETEARRAKVSE